MPLSKREQKPIHTGTAMQVGDTVTAKVTTTNKSLVKGESYRIVKINEALTRKIYWVKGKRSGDVQTMAFEEHLTT
tara:strand:+ start:59 stop:286 length:228 start_codon:yes stop_codon:yes gene_type:complete